VHSARVFPQGPAMAGGFVIRESGKSGSRSRRSRSDRRFQRQFPLQVPVSTTSRSRFPGPPLFETPRRGLGTIWRGQCTDSVGRATSPRSVEARTNVTSTSSTRKAGKVWRVEVTRNKRPSGSQATKSPAIIQARRLATRNTSELVVHNQDRKSASAAATATIRTRREASPAAE